MTKGIVINQSDEFILSPHKKSFEMKKSTRNADATSKKKTKRPFKSAYAVEKHDGTRKSLCLLLPPPPLQFFLCERRRRRPVTLLPKKKKKKRYLKVVSPKTAKNEERNEDEKAFADDTKEDENENAINGGH